MQRVLQAVSKPFLLNTAAFIALNLLVVLLKAPNVSLDFAADGKSWFVPAVALLQHGTLSDPQYPSLEFYRGPGVALFFAGMMYLAGGVSVSAIVVGHLCLLYATAVLFRMTVKDWFPRYADLGMALILFNPNLLGSAYFVQSEIVATFTAMVVFFFLLRYTKGNTSLTTAVALGASLGATCLVRTNPIFLVYSLPAILPIIGLIERHKISLGGTIVRGVVAMVVALAVMAPWAFALYQKTGIVSWSALISPRAEYEYIYDELIILEATHSGIGTPEAKVALDKGPRANFIRSFGSQWDKLTEAERLILLRDHTVQLLIGYPAGDWARCLGLSVAQFMFGGGAGAWHNLFGAFPSGLVRIFSETAKTDPLQFFRRVAAEAPFSALALSAICLMFVVLTRLLAVGGVVEMWRKRMFGLLLIVLSIVVYFALSTVFQGQARYRSAVEPELMILAVAGWSFFRSLFEKRQHRSVARAL